MALGDIDYTYGVLVMKGTSKTNTAIAVGDLCYYDTDGWGPMTAAAKTGKPFGVAIDAITAKAATQYDVRVVVRGVVTVKKVASGAIAQGQGLMASSTAGAVAVFAAAGANFTADEVAQYVGMAYAAAADAVALIECLLG